ncbi:MAG: hypothetical protein PHW76_03030 [Alphaproteobacteria bacterium]|nr:hypothetical protein [Alphaproteobacteria bacterium]
MSKAFFIFSRLKKTMAAIAAVGFLFALAVPAAAKENTDVLVGVKILSMLNRELPAPLVMGIVYDPGNSESKSSAESIKAVLDAGVKTSEGAGVSGRLIPLAEIDKLSQVSFAFITTGVKAQFDRIAQISASHGILTMTSDIECVRANKCILGIESQNVVQIYFSRAASETAKINFDSAFIMLVKKV